MEIEKDSPDGVMFWALKNEWAFARQKRAKGDSGSQQYVNEGMQGHGESGELKK